MALRACYNMVWSLDETLGCFAFALPHFPFDSPYMLIKISIIHVKKDNVYNNIIYRTNVKRKNRLLPFRSTNISSSVGFHWKLHTGSSCTCGMLGWMECALS